MRSFKELVPVHLNSPYTGRESLPQQRRNSPASRHNEQPIVRMRSYFKEGALPRTSVPGLRRKIRQENSFAQKPQKAFVSEKATVDERIRKLEEQLQMRDNYIAELKEKNESLKLELANAQTLNEHITQKNNMKAESRSALRTSESDYNSFVKYSKVIKSAKRKYMADKSPNQLVQYNTEVRKVNKVPESMKVDTRKWNSLRKLIEVLYRVTSYKDFFTILEKYCYW
eukprot:TRINITY_DN9689_c0_g2_i5.p1 TRINITY_DN9689_c0_g2~~TRINITY_DN9689_c0_g2_i5.p1  ORF type:complete len:227 (-),score=41.99 TRINITY_DN9689_c0_g2_i5:1163-1843(-)